ncbi:MAG: hypothetical protein ACXV3U_01415 [Halobacteriota archaeon]
MHVTTEPREWQFQKEVICFNCKSAAAQIVRIGGEVVSVACVTCQASRTYEIRSVIYGTDTPPMPPAGNEYDVWEFRKDTTCPHCKEQSTQNVYLDEHKVNAVCDECGFTRVFKFSSVNIPHK